MSFPPAHLLLGAAAAETALMDVRLPRWRAWLVGAILGLLPDGDFVLGLVTGNTSAYHGTFTHSLTAVAVVATVAWVFAGPAWAAVSAAGYGSHLIVDLMDARGRTNVLLAWPVSDERPNAVAGVFPTVVFEQGEGFFAALRSLFRPEGIASLLEQTGIAAAFFAAAIAFSTVVGRARRS